MIKSRVAVILAFITLTLFGVTLKDIKSAQTEHYSSSSSERMHIATQNAMIIKQNNEIITLLKRRP